MSTDIVYQDIDEFYGLSKARFHSDEAGYGVFWTEPGKRTPWRVAYVRNTGEIYARCQNTGQVRVLACVPADPVPKSDLKSIWYNTLETILNGWATQCAQPGSMAWLRERLSAHPAPTQN